VIASPPSSGAVNDTVICASPGVTTGWPGADGTVLGLATADTGDEDPEPSAFFAVTVQVYDLPFVRPPTVTGEAAPEAEPNAPPFADAQIAS
jgi:hypothetical protein